MLGNFEQFSKIVQNNLTSSWHSEIEANMVKKVSGIIRPLSPQ